MKRWIVLIAAMMIAGLSAQATVIDEWNFVNGTNVSDQGKSLQGRWTNGAQLVPGATNGVNEFKLTPTNAFFSGQINLSSTIDITNNPVVAIEVTYTAIDFSASADTTGGVTNYAGAPDAQFQIRLWDHTGANDWAALAIQDNFNSDTVFGRINTKSGGGLNAGRLVNSLGPDSTERTVRMELNFTNNTVRMSSPAWQWSGTGAPGFVPGSGGGSGNPATFEMVMDLSAWTKVDKFQHNFANWTSNDSITVSHILIETVPDKTDAHLVDQDAITVSGTAPATNSFSYDVLEGDVVALLTAANIGSDISTNSATFSGTASLDPVAYNRRNQGATASYWYTTALSDGTVDVELITSNTYATVGGYQVRAAAGEILSLLDASKNGDAGVESVTNTYFGGGASGLFLEAVASAGTNSTPLNPDTVIDKIDSQTKRSVSHGSFTNASPLVNVWTNTAGSTAIIGLTFDSVEAWSRVEYWDFDSDAASQSFGSWSNSGVLDSEWNFGGPGEIATDGAGSLVVSNHQGSVTRKLPKAATANANLTNDVYASAFTNGKYRLEMDFSSWDLPDGANSGNLELQALSEGSNIVAAIRLRVRNTPFNTTWMQLIGRENSALEFNTYGSGSTNKTTATSARVEFDFDTDTIEYYLDGVLKKSTNSFNEAGFDQLRVITDSNWSSNNVVTINSMGLSGFLFDAPDVVVDTPTSLWNDWISTYPGAGTSTGFLDHADSDLLDNLTEYAFGGDPADGGDQGNTPEQSQVSDGGTNYLEYIYFARDDAGDRGLAYLLTTDTDLVFAPGWTNARYEVTGTNTSTGIPGFNAVTNRMSTDTEDQQFIRLQIEFTP